MNDLHALRRDRYRSKRTHNPEDARNDFRRDRDRILYSSAFRRLSGITQVVSPSGSHPTHNRLTHSLEVAQIARSISERLLATYGAAAFEPAGGLDPDVAEAAALAHDLGHPPFGHVAETTLNDRLAQHGLHGGFEGNAQSFRIVNVLATRYKEIEGLNLTRATLSGMSKYPWVRSESGPRHSKWGSYASEAEIMAWSRQHLPPELRGRETIEAGIMDWSDDFAYAVHDLEDFFRVGLVPLDFLSNSEDERQRFLDGHVSRLPEAGVASRADVLDGLVALFPAEPYAGTRLSKATLRSLTSILINRFVTAVDFDPVTLAIVVPEPIRIQVELLKSITRHYVIQSRALVTTRFGYASIISSLFEMLMAVGIAGDRDRHYQIGIFPDFYRERMETAGFAPDEVGRTVADTIASLTEAQAISLHQRLTGNSLGAVLDPIL